MDSEKWDQERSKLLFRTMDCLGYSEELIQMRKYFNRNLKMFPAFKSFASIVGSKAEGISTYHESDTDVLLITNSITCGEDLGK